MQQTSPEDQHPAELPHRAQYGHALRFAVDRAVLCLEFGVSMDLLPVRAKRRITVVQQRRRQRANRAVDLEPLVYHSVYEPPVPLPKQPELTRVPTGASIVVERLPEEVGNSLQAVTGARVHGPDYFGDLFGQLGTNLLIGVEAQDPWLGCLSDSIVLLLRVTGPIPCDNPSPEFLGQCRGPIDASGVDHQDFGRPLNTLKAPFDVLPLIFGNDDDTDRRGG